MPDSADLPYQLRPNKFIDRQIFVDLLSRVLPTKPEGSYVYVSMGGKHLVDHESIYRRVGVRNLFSFDGSADVVARMVCNRPIEGAVCREMYSSALAGEIDEILSGFTAAENLVIWLDYTRPQDRLAQLQEFIQVLRKCQAGDVIRITLNSDPFTLRGQWDKAGFESPAHYRAWRLFEQIGDFLPNELEAVLEDELAKTLALAVANAVSKAEIGTEIRFVPVLLTSYADRQRMLTVTVLALQEGEPLPTGLNGWEFLPPSWSAILDISAPDLSIREKIAIDRHLAEEPESIIAAVGFMPASERAAALAQLQSYKRLHRFYPTFYAIGIQ